MCYSAQITAAYQKLVRMTGATLSLAEFAVLYAHDPGKKRPKTPKAMDDAFRAGASPAELAVGAEVEQWNRAEATILEQELFANRKRLADAERALQVKETKKAREDGRIAGNKIERPKAGPGAPAGWGSRLWWRAWVPTGRPRPAKSRICCRSLRSPTTPSPRWPPPDTTG